MFLLAQLPCARDAFAIRFSKQNIRPRRNDEDLIDPQHELETTVLLTRMTTITTLRDRISAAARSHDFGGLEVRYLPSDAVTILATSTEISNAIHRDHGKLSMRYSENKDSFANGVLEKGRRMFLMCIYADVDMGYLYELLDSGLTDANIKSNSRSVSTEWTRFLTAEWISEPTRLNNYTFGETIPKFRPLPIMFDTDIGTQIGKGSSARVLQARFLKQYCDIQQFDEDQNDPTLTELCALKKFETGTEARKSWENESDFATWLPSCPELMNDPHITKTFIGFMYQGRRCLVSELAAESLQGLLDSKKTTTYDLAWFRKQIIGLTRALSNIHGPKQGKIGSHNDIQLVNILVFPNQGDVLKFTDWGATKLTETAGNSTISPSKDILYLGSVFVNLLIWMNDGSESLEYSYASDWFVADPLDPESGILDSKAEKVFDDLRKRLPNMLSVIDVIHDMVNGKTKTQVKASEALLRFEAIPEPW